MMASGIQSPGNDVWDCVTRAPCFHDEAGSREIMHEVLGPQSRCVQKPPAREAQRTRGNMTACVGILTYPCIAVQLRALRRVWMERTLSAKRLSVGCSLAQPPRSGVQNRRGCVKRRRSGGGIIKGYVATGPAPG